MCLRLRRDSILRPPPLRPPPAPSLLPRPRLLLPLWILLSPPLPRPCPPAGHPLLPLLLLLPGHPLLPLAHRRPPLAGLRPPRKLSRPPRTTRAATCCRPSAKGSTCGRWRSRGSRRSATTWGTMWRPFCRGVSPWSAATRRMTHPSLTMKSGPTEFLFLIVHPLTVLPSSPPFLTPSSVNLTIVS